MRRRIVDRVRVAVLASYHHNPSRYRRAVRVLGRLNTPTHV